MPKGVYIHPPQCGFQKGNKIGIGNKWSLGLKHTNEWKENARKRWLGEKNPNWGKDMSNEKAPNWKGDYVGYGGIHHWVAKYKGNPKFCEMCETKIANKYEWCNIDHKYSRDLNDYVRMCTRCHRNYDKINNKRYLK